MLDMGLCARDGCLDVCIPVGLVDHVEEEEKRIVSNFPLVFDMVTKSALFRRCILGKTECVTRQRHPVG
jgi:hypothetical protein